MTPRAITFRWWPHGEMMIFIDAFVGMSKKNAKTVFTLMFSEPDWNATAIKTLDTVLTSPETFMDLKHMNVTEKAKNRFLQQIIPLWQQIKDKNHYKSTEF